MQSQRSVDSATGGGQDGEGVVEGFEGYEVVGEADFDAGAALLATDPGGGAAEKGLLDVGGTAGGWGLAGLLGDDEVL